MTAFTLKKFATTATLSVAVLATLMPTLANAKSAKKATAEAVTISAENALLAKDLIAFNEAINATAVKSQKLQEAFIKKHQNDKSPDLQVKFIKEAIKSLEQQKADLQAVNLTEPSVVAMREKFIKTIDSQKSVYTFMVNTPNPTPAQQKDVAKQLEAVQKLGEQAQSEFIQLAKKAGLQPSATTQ